MPPNTIYALNGDFSKAYTTIVEGQGVYVLDEDGKRYVDAIGGVGVANIGHGVEEVIEAITNKARRLAFSYSGLVDFQPRQALAAKLQAWAPAGMGATKTLFCSGGSEANEAALKLAYQNHTERGNPSKQKIIRRWQSYHGNTIGALSMSGRTQWRRRYAPYLLDFPHTPSPYCYRCPWGKGGSDCCLEWANDLRRIISQEGAENISAFIAEPIIGTSMSAVVPPPPEYYGIIRDICDENDILFIVDEVMTGVGRTGKKWGIEHWGVTPDIITAAKGLTGGYAPLGATILGENVWQAMAAGSGSVTHSYTFGGNPLSCATGVAVLEYIEKNGLVSQAGVMGEKLLSKLRSRLGNSPFVGDVRGLGLFIGVELVADKETKQPFSAEWDVTHRVEAAAFANRLFILGGMTGLIDGVAGDHFELLPPYTIQDDDLDFIVDTLDKSIDEVMAALPTN